MKKVLSVLLAIVMMFSVMSVAFAAEEAPVDTTVAAEDTTDDVLDEIKDIPVWQVKVGLKLAKVALKVVLIFSKLGFIDLSGIIEQLQDYIANATQPADPAPEETTTAAPAIA